MAIYKKGSDPVALRASAERITAHARACEAVRSDAGRALHALDGHWRGGDLQQLMRSWPPLDAQLGRFGDDLGALAEVLRRNAGQQDSTSGGGAALGAGASAAATGAGGNGGPGGPGGNGGQPHAPVRHVADPSDPATAAARAELDAKLAGMTPAEREAYLKSDEFRAWMAQSQANADAAKLSLDQLFDSGQLQPGGNSAYAAFLKEYWGETAMRDAGIDPAAWDPDKGFDANHATVNKVYDYYGRFFLDDPSTYQWAGMANMIGPSFAGGFADLALMRDVAQGVEDASGLLPPGVNPPPLELIHQLAGLGDSELRFYETQFLSMQREIFIDQGGMHEAYASGGLDEIDRMARAGYLDSRTDQAWHDIASGDPTRVTHGNEQLLYREQHDIINDDYERMRNHPVTGEAVTYGLTMLGTPSIPGASAYGDLFNVHGSIETPGPRTIFGHDNPLQGSVDWRTPFPDGNIAGFDDRWKLIQANTLPTYQDLITNHPEQAQAVVSSDFEQRLQDARLTHNVGPTIDRIISGFDVDANQ